MSVKKVLTLHMAYTSAKTVLPRTPFVVKITKNNKQKSKGRFKYIIESIKLSSTFATNLYKIYCTCIRHFFKILTSR